MEEGVRKLQWDDKVDWLGQLFQSLNISGWTERLFGLKIYELRIFLCLFMTVPCLLQYMQKMVNNSVQHMLYIKQKGGSVAEQNELNDVSSKIELLKILQEL